MWFDQESQEFLSHFSCGNLRLKFKDIKKNNNLGYVRGAVPSTYLPRFFFFSNHLRIFRHEKPSNKNGSKNSPTRVCEAKRLAHNITRLKNKL